MKPTIETLHEGIPEVLSSWEFYAMAIAGIAAFALQQVSLSSGFLATSVATVSTANPIVSVLIGTLLFDERLSQARVAHRRRLRRARSRHVRSGDHLHRP